MAKIWIRDGDGRWRYEEETSSHGHTWGSDAQLGEYDYKAADKMFDRRCNDVIHKIFYTELNYYEGPKRITRVTGEPMF